MLKNYGINWKKIKPIIGWGALIGAGLSIVGGFIYFLVSSEMESNEKREQNKLKGQFTLSTSSTEINGVSYTLSGPHEINTENSVANIDYDFRLQLISIRGYNLSDVFTFAEFNNEKDITITKSAGCAIANKIFQVTSEQTDNGNTLRDPEELLDRAKIFHRTYCDLSR